MKEKLPAVDPAARVVDLLRFYEDRGYQSAVGAGRTPAVLVIDFSRAFTGGRSEFPGGDFSEEVRQTLRILDEARRGSAPVVFTTIAYDEPARDAGLWGRKVPWLAHCRSGTDMVEIDPALEVRPGETLIVKKFPSAFYGTKLDAVLVARDVDTLIVTGCTTSVCIRATAIDAMQRGYRTLIAAEAVGEFNRELHAVHLADLNARYADVVSVDEVLSYLASLNRT